MVNTGDNNNKCKHHFVELWKLDRCSHCGLDLPAKRLKQEIKSSKAIQQQDAENSEQQLQTLIHGAVRIDWLLAFTFDHQCWTWSTARVVRDIVRPATLRHNRCRYSTLPSVQPYTGKPTVFMSHCWAAKWGDLVMASVHGARHDRYVWIDIFAVRQWPGNVLDLNFRTVIRQCTAVIVAVSKIPELCRRPRQQANEDDGGDGSAESVGSAGSASSSSSSSVMNPQLEGSNEDQIDLFLSSERGAEIKKTIAFFRLWCVVELSSAVAFNIPVIVKGGTATLLNQQEYDYDSSGMYFMMTNLALMVDIESSESLSIDPI